MAKAKTVSSYIAAAPPPARVMLKQLRAAIKAAAPKAEEKISYAIPYYEYRGRLIYFAAFKHHLSVYVMGRGRKKFARELKPYQTSYATYQIPIGTAVPVALIKKIVKDRVRENEGKK